MYFKPLNRFLISVLIVLASVQICFAQPVTVTGTVNDPENNPLVGVTVFVKGKTIGTLTDLNGKYQLKVQKADTLAFSFVGLKNEEVVVRNQTVIDIKLKEDLVTMNDVMVIGYGTVKKSDLTGAVASVDAEELTKMASSNVIRSLQGQVAGVSIESSNGSQPGGGMSIKIRGTNTLNNNLPLYVVDDIITGDISQLNSSDIKSMEILKDASACAIYGSRASNGVVIITTKKGQSGEPVVNFSAYTGVQSPTKYLNLANQKEYLEINADVVANSTNATTPPANDPTSPYYIDSLDTDWQAIMLSPAVMQNYSLSISGGNNSSTYYVSGGYVDQDGILLGTGYKKYSAKVNTNATKGRFRFDENLTLLKYNKDDETIGSAGRGAVIEMLKMTPNIAPVDPSQVGGYGAVETDIVGHAAKNPYGAAYLFDNHESGYRISGNVSGSVELFKGLKYSLRAGTDVSNSKYVSHKPTYYMGPEDNNLSSATLKESLGENTFYILENLLNFDRAFGKHSINAVLGYTYQNNNYQAYTMSTSGLPNNDIAQIGAGNPDAVTVSSYQTKSSMISYLGRAIYSYDSRYLFTMTVRRDGSSRFSPKNKWGNFPSLSVGWNVHKESFFPTQDVVKTMKLRGSWGKLGNQEIGDYQYTGYINSNTSYVFGTDQNLVHGATQVAYPAQELKWEETASTNLGVDLGLLKNKLTASVDYYRNHTTDMLVSVPIPISAGSLPASILQNYGEMRSSGFEFSLEYRKSEGKFNYSINANISTEKNEVIKLGSKNPLWYGEYENGEGSTTKTMAGGSVGDFYLYHVDGIFQSDAEILAYNKYYTDNNLPIPQAAAAPGDIRFLDYDKNGVLNNNDKIYAGSPIPDFAAGVNFTANYKNFDFSMFWYGTYGNEIVNGMRYWTESMNTNLNYSARCLDRWTITNPSTTMPRAVQGDPNGNTRPSDRWLEDGSYLRLKNIELGYQLNEKALAKIHIKSLRVYASAQNLFTLTKYLGYDPELGGNSDSAGYNSTTADGVSAFSVRGVDRNIYPTAKTILFGVQLSF